MVALIEDQIHAFLITEEEKCYEQAVEDYRHDPKDKKKPRKRTIEKPWRRGIHPQLCQETDLLPMVSEYDYDLEDTAFQDYCRGRGILDVAGEPRSERWGYFLDFNIGKDSFLENPYFQFSQSSKKYTSDQMEFHWKIIRLGRAKLQDCWEMFRAESHQ